MTTGAGGEAKEAKDWREWFEAMLREAPVAIYYPICGGAAECVTACPQGWRIWELKPMKTPFLSFGYRVRLRPVMVRPELCRKCFECVKACPTGAIRPSTEGPPKHPTLTLLKNLLKLPFKKRYGLRFLMREEHKEAFKKANKRV